MSYFKSAKSRWVVLVLVLSVVLIYVFYPKAKAPQSGAAQSKKPVPVAVVTAQLQDVPLTIQASGQVAALQTLDVKPVVAGTVTQILFKEGQLIKAGQVLFQLDDASERAALDRARAQLARDQALLNAGDRVWRDQQKLFEQGFISAAALDASRQNADALRASLAGDKAAIHSAEVDQRYKTIRAAISGRAGVINVVLGSVVSASMTTPLVSLTQTNPIGVTFTVAERDLPLVLAAQKAGEVPVLASLPDAPAKTFEGRLVFVDSGVDSKSGTVRLKAEFDNADSALWPGLYVTLSMPVGVEKNVVVLPVAAVQTGPEGTFVYVVGANKKVQPQPVTLKAIREERAIISGLEAGTPVVGSSALNLRPNSEIQVLDKKPAAGHAKKQDRQP